MLFPSDYGYSHNPLSRCIACGSSELNCCDGHGKRISFDRWVAAVDAEICRLEDTPRNEVTAPYAEMYADGLTVTKAVECSLSGVSH